MIISHEGGRYWATSTFAEREPLKAAGFRWDRDAKRWWTDDAQRAAKLAKFADASCRDELARVKAEHDAAIEASRAKDSDVEIPCPDGLSYMPYQRAGIAFAAARPSVLIADQMGLGKQQPVDTLISTPAGWRPIGDLAAGDQVTRSDGRAAMVTGVFPQGVKPAYRVHFSDGSSVETGPEHLWTVSHVCGGKRRESLTLTTEQLRTRPVLHRSHRNGRRTELDLKGVTLYLPILSGPVEFGECGRLPVEPYLLGALIANGSLSNGTPHLVCGAGDAAHVHGRCPQDLLGSVRQYENVVHVNVLRTVNAIRILKLDIKSGQKFIPKPYLRSRPEDRIALLHGLMDGDGSCSKQQNRVTYHTTSKQLARDVVELVEGLGGIASSRSYPRDEYTMYSVRIRLPRSIKPFSLPRKLNRYRPGKNASPCRTVARVEYVRDVESVCISVDSPDQLYATEHYILTHNTVQGVGLINLDESLRKILIVCPASLKINWTRELRRWLTRDLTIGIADSQYLPPTNVVVINYDILTKHDLGAIAWDMVVSDEAHYAKNPKAKRTKALFAIQARRRVLLTGTPIVNRPIELWPLISYLDPDRWNSKTFFRYARRYCDAKQVPAGRRMVWDFSGSSHLDELQDTLRTTIMVRRLKSEVLTELPPKVRQVIEIPTNGASEVVAAERSAHELLEDVERAEAEVDVAELADDRDAYEAAVMRLRSLRGGAMFDELSRIRHETAVAKIPYAIEHIEGAIEAGGKVVVFAWHHDVIEALAEAFGRKAVVIYGETSLQDRQSAVDRFQTDDSCRVFIGSIGAAGVGLTLTASSHVVFVEFDWVPGNMEQAADRCHRIGQRNSVLVQLLAFDGSIDARIAHTIVRKQRIIDDALDSAAPTAEQLADRVTSAEDGRAKRDASAPALPPLSVDQVAAIHLGLRMLAGMCDGAQAEDGMGFSKIDTHFGHSLAARGELTEKMARAGQRLVRKYRRQLPVELVAQAGAAPKRAEEAA